jgi:hypothetical protein
MLERTLAAGKPIEQINEEDAFDGPGPATGTTSSNPANSKLRIIPSAPPAEPTTDLETGTDKSESFMLQPDLVRSTSPDSYVAV